MRMPAAAFALSFLLVGLAPACSATERSVTLSVPSISCPICATRVRAALQGKAGVEGVVVDGSTKVARIALSDPRASADSFVAWVHDAGYVSTIVTDTWAFRLEGVGAQAQRNVILEALRAVPGVRSASSRQIRGATRILVVLEKGRVLEADLQDAVRRLLPQRARFLKTIL